MCTFYICFSDKQIIIFDIIFIGNPPPKVIWYMNGKPVEADGENVIIGHDATLTIRSTDIEHISTFQCMASNVGGNATLEVNVNVHSMWYYWL